MPEKFKLFMWAVLSIVLFFGVFVPSQLDVVAQNGPEPFYTIDVMPNTISPYWSNNSHYFVFTGEPWIGAVQADYEAWSQYDVTTGEITTSKHWPLQPELTLEQLAEFEVGTFQNEYYGKQPSRIFVSPNGRYVVYGSHLPNDWSPNSYQTTLGIADLQTGNHTIIEIPIPAFGAVNCLSGSFCVLWSDDSSAFMVSASIPIGVTIQYYFTGFVSDLADIKATEISEYAFVLHQDGSVGLATPEAGDTQLYTLGFLDISDSNHALLNFSQRLVLWNPSDEAQSRVLEIENIEIFNAAFYPDTHKKILYVSEAGLSEYDILSNQSTLLDSDINSRYTYFSRNGRFLVNTIHDEEKDTWAFFMVDLGQYGVQ